MKKIKNLKRLTALGLATVTALSFVACGKKTADDNKEVTLKWVMSGPGKQKDADTVWAKYNEELQKMPGFKNTTVEFDVIPTSEYAQKFMLMLTSDEKVDIANTLSGQELAEPIGREIPRYEPPELCKIYFTRDHRINRKRDYSFQLHWTEYEEAPHWELQG